MIKSAKKAEAKRNCVINSQNYNFNHILTRTILILSKRYESTKVNCRTWLHVPSWAHWSTSSDTHQAVEKWEEIFTEMYNFKLN